MKKIVQRSCIGCNIKKDKKELIRIVKQQDGKVLVDKTGKMCGRGAYICGDKECLEKVIKTNKLERILETKLSNEIYNELRGVVLEQGK